MSTAKKIGIGLLILLLILALVGWLVTRPDTADLAWAKVTGTDPQLAEPESETFPTVRIAEPVGWAANEAPTPAAGLTVNRFAEGLDHPRTMLTLPNGDVLVSLTRAPAMDAPGERPAIYPEFEAAMAAAEGRAVALEPVERFAFYERAKATYATIATGERRLYANIIVKKGVIR